MMKKVRFGSFDNESPYSFKGGKIDLLNLIISLYHIVICKINPNTRKITQKVVVKCGSQSIISYFTYGIISDNCCLITIV